MASRSFVATRRIVASSPSALTLAPKQRIPSIRAFTSSHYSRNASSSSTATDANPWTASVSPADSIVNSAAASTSSKPSVSRQKSLAEKSSAGRVREGEISAKTSKPSNEPQFEIPQCLLPTQQLPFTHRHHVANLYLRSYTSEVEAMDQFADFARKAAYAIGIPVEGMTRLPTKTTLWTVLRSPFVHKKSQENFWRKTHSRVIKVYDANPEVVDRWLLFLRIHAVAGLHMKAELFRHHSPGVGSRMTKELEDKQLQIAQRIGTPSSSSPASDSQKQATTKQAADKIKHLAQGIVQEEMDKIEKETASSDKPQ